VSLAVLFAAMIGMSPAEVVTFIQSCSRPEPVTLSQLIEFSYNMFADQVKSLANVESVVIVSFGVVLLMSQNYRLQRETTAPQKCSLLDQALTLIWRMLIVKDNFQSQAIVRSFGPLLQHPSVMLSFLIVSCLLIITSELIAGSVFLKWSSFVFETVID
jgi:hypothetical protein